MKHRACIIERVFPGPAKEAGIRKGDRIVSINGHAIHDELDYRFFRSDDLVELEIHRPATGEHWTKEFKGYQDLGLEFAPWRPLRCHNHCIFCFIDQLPRGLRSSLYVKDEDYRLSFLNGNFLTLSTTPDTLVQRICSMRLSPLYVSVHATDPKVRNKMLGRKDSRDILDMLGTLIESGITLHAQVVLCPGVNDGEILDQTVRDLIQLYPGVASMAIVPVGLTKYRRSYGLYHLNPVTREYSLRVLSKINRIQNACKMKYDTPFVFLSDEFYIRANRRFPAYSDYGDFPQLENGVGMIPKFLHSLKQKRVAVHKRPLRGRSVIVVTGKLAYPYIAHYIKTRIELSGVNVRLFAVSNRFLGPRITVAGLLAARDIEESLRPLIRPGNVLLIPDVMLKQDEDIFLDDVSMEELGERLHVDINKFPSCPDEFEKILHTIALTL